MEQLNRKIENNWEDLFCSFISLDFYKEDLLQFWNI